MEKSGNIHVVEAEDNFKRVHKSIIENKNIDCETLGIYTRIIVLGAKWNLNIKGLSTHLDISDSKIRKSIAALEREGYIVRTAVRGEGGKFFGWDYKILPLPIEKSQRSSAGRPTSQKTDTRSDGQVGLPTTRFTDNTENGEENNNKPKETIYLKENKTKDNILSWRNDFHVYIDIVNEAKQKVLNDTEYRQYIEKYYPNADYEATLNKLVDGFWGKQDGWEYNKKKRKGKTINMFSALKKNMDRRERIVYKQKDNQKKNVPSQGRNETLKPDMPILNEDGDMMDGTFYKQNARWYISEIDCKAHSIPVKAPMRPDKRYEWDSVNNRWYLPRDKWEASDELW